MHQPIKSRPETYYIKEWSTCLYTMKVYKVLSKAGGKCFMIKDSYSKMGSQLNKRDCTSKSI